MNRSNFPAEIDSFPILTDITIADVVNIRRYKELREKSSLTTSEQAELNALITNLTTAGKLITAEYHNKVTDSIVATQTFFKDNVDDYIKQKQEEFDRTLQQFSDKGNWSPEITYQQWNTVVYNHETYLSRKNNNLNHIPDEENSEWWHKVAQRGKQGSPGVGLTFLGSYDDSVLYNPGSAVYYENVIWYAMNPTQGNKPEAGSPYWTVFLANSGVVIDSNPPAAPYTGQIYVDISNLNYPKIKYWTGTQWSEIGTSANKVTITDAGNYFDSNNVEGALQELGSKQKQIENNFSKVFVADGTANTITVTTGFFNLKDGQSFTFIAKYNNNGATTAINADGKGARNVYKPNTTTTPTFIAGKAYTVWYDASKSCFFIKASAEGNATADSVLAGRTFSNDEDTGLVGTMPDQSGKTVSSAGFTRDGTTIKVKLQKGYYDTSSQVTISDPDFVADNIRAGKEIFGINGTFTSDATAAAGSIFSGKTAYVNGVKLTGTMPDNGTKIITPSTVNQAIPAGYHNGQGYVVGSPNLVASNIKSGVNIFGVTGTLEEFKGKSYSGANLYFDTLYTVDNIGFIPKLIIIKGYTDYIALRIGGFPDEYRIYGTLAAAKDFSVSQNLETVFDEYTSAEGGVRLSIVTWGSNSVEYKIIATDYGYKANEFTYFRASDIYVFG